MYRMLTVAIAIAFTAGCASVENGTQTANSPDSNLVCKKLKDIGSKIPTRRCATKEQWEAAEAATEEAIEKIQRDSANRAVQN